MAAVIEKTAPVSSPEAVKLKDQGNAAFAAGKFEEAVKAFSSAIELDSENHVLYSNRAAAYTSLAKKTGDDSLLEKAIADGEKCTSLSPSFGKGYSRTGAALFMLQRYQEAVKVYAAGLAQEPGSRLLVDGLQQAQKYLSEQIDDGSDTRQSSDVVIGIDLGTTYSCVGVWKNNGVVMIPNERGSITSPSWVCFSETGKRYTGQAAKNMAARFPTNTIFDVKRIIGQRFEDEGVAADVDRFPFAVVGSEGGAAAGKKATGKPLIQVDLGMHGKKSWAPEEISAMVLSYLKRTAEDYLKHPVTKAVITVPAYFNDSQRSATKAAGKIAGLDVLRIINEPTAAALSYGLDRLHKDQPAKVLIFDLGGGTFDVSVLSIEGGVTEVKATGGDTRLGGEDFDMLTTQFLVKEAVEQGLPDITEDARAIRRLQTAVENAKRALSASAEADIHVEALFTTDQKKKGESNFKTIDFKYKLSRAKFEQLNLALFNKCLDTVKKVLKDAKLKPSEIDDIVLVGGSTRIPKIQELLQEYFGGKELCKSLNPDEAVAYGAAVQGAILNGARDSNTSNMLLMDVTPLSLGIETTGRVMSVIVPRNSSIPTVKTQTYTTEADYQTEIDVLVYEGERAKTTENNLLGKFTISGIERAKRGVPKIDVSFSLDSNGILNVSARDQTTGAEATTTIERSGRTSDADIERMVKEAQKYKAQDDEAIKRVEAINELESMINELKEISLESKSADKARILDEAAQGAQAWIDEHGESSRVAEIKLKRKALETTLFKYNKTHNKH